jgi:uncharacterized membrane protein YcaP (DUF421 family)
MPSIVRAVAVYLILMLLFRLSGKRTFSDMTPFDFVLLLILSEAVQQALIADDNSFTNAFLLVFTMIALDVLLSLLKRQFPRVEKVLDGVPVMIVEKGRVLKDRIDAERIDENDILAAAREQRGLRSLEEIDYAVLEQNGRISIIPRRDTAG